MLAVALSPDPHFLWCLFNLWTGMIVQLCELFARVLDQSRLLTLCTLWHIYALDNPDGLFHVMAHSLDHSLDDPDGLFHTSQGGFQPALATAPPSRS